MKIVVKYFAVNVNEATCVFFVIERRNKRQDHWKMQHSKLIFLEKKSYFRLVYKVLELYYVKIIEKQFLHPYIAHFQVVPPKKLFKTF